MSGKQRDEIMKKLHELEDKVNQVIELLTKQHYSGTIHYGEPNHISNNNTKYFDVELMNKKK